MSDLISILSEIRSSYNCFDEKEEPYYRALGEAIRLVSAQQDGAFGYVSDKEVADAPTIDAEPVRHGRWEQISPARIYECSKCGQEVMTSDIDVYKYCHGCGAKMNDQ